MNENNLILTRIKVEYYGDLRIVNSRYKYDIIATAMNNVDRFWEHFRKIQWIWEGLYRSILQNNPLHMHLTRTWRYAVRHHALTI